MFFTAYLISLSVMLSSSPSVNEWIKKLWYIYMMEYYTAERRKELLSFVTVWVALDRSLFRK